jgi:phospholipid/cholesterol/gamma-HCH transport system substrate-binding protein
MKQQQHFNDYKLGIFLFAGLVALVFSLYMIGKNQSLFTSSFELRARFRDVAGLMPGNNVRYSGIQNGSVKSIHIVDDTTIEVVMFINKDTRAHIRKSSYASIGTEGLMGNKVINIIPGEMPSPPAGEMDVLRTKDQRSLGEAMGTLYKTGDNAAIAAEELVATLRKINNSPVLQTLLYDERLPENVHESLVNIKASSTRISHAAAVLEDVLVSVKNGKGTAGLLLSDEQARAGTWLALQNIQKASEEASGMMTRLNDIAGDLQNDLKSQRGAVYALIQDTSLPGRLNRSMQSIEAGTAAFSENMEAFKHNFLTRGYFRKQERKNRKK